MTAAACCGCWARSPAARRRDRLRYPPGDAFLLCSDGFWEYVYNEEMQADLCKARTPEEWTEFMLLRHIRRVPSGNDNFSFIAVFVEEEP